MTTIDSYTGIVDIPALAGDGDYRTRKQDRVTNVRGEHAIDLNIAPGIFVTRAVSRLTKADVLPFEERISALEAAAENFARGTIDGLSPEEYHRVVSEVSGSPLSIVRGSASLIEVAAKSVEQIIAAAAPAGVSRSSADPALANGGALWIPRGRTLAVNAAGNSPAIHGTWIPALALGFRVVVRPSRREPLTPYRLIRALREAGFGNDQVMMLATDHAGADELLQTADVGIAFGGEDIVAKYASDSSISVQGPGRSKILITSDVDWRDHLDVIVDSITAGGGANCMNASAIYVEGDAGELAGAIAERLSQLPALPPLDEQAVLPVRTLDTAKDLERHVLSTATGSRVWLGEDGIVADLRDGSAALRPAVFELSDVNDPRLQLEFPFPCVWIVPWCREAGVGPLRHTLAMTALTKDQELIESLLLDPSVSNIKVGDTPTYWSEPHLPHEDYLLSALMRAKAVKLTR